MPPIMILTEDGSKQGFDTLRALTREIVRVLDPLANRSVVKITPPSDRAAQLGAQATRWKSTSPRDRVHQVALRSEIASQLQQGHYVFLHVDGDRAWADRATSENRAKLDAFVTRPVANLLRGPRRRGGTPPSEEEAASMLRKLVFLVPFYSIEAWTYQNLAAARRICVEQHDGQHLEVFARWSDDRGLLDEIGKVKEECCLRDQHNAELAADHFPTREVVEVGKSFAACIDEIRERAPCLLAALASTHPTTPQK